MSSFPHLTRILAAHVARALRQTPDESEESAGAAAITGVLADPALDPAEEAVVAAWEGEGSPAGRLFDRLLQTRVDRAVREGAWVEARALGIEGDVEVPEVRILREDGAEGAGAGNSVVQFLSDGVDPVDLAPGAKIDQFVDMLVLANQTAAATLGETLGARAVAGEEDGARIDLLLTGTVGSIQVFDVERELARLEELLRKAIPDERRPQRTGTWSFGRDLTGELLGGKYHVRALKGKGAFKTVYEGEDEMLGARVAIAVLNPKGARSPRALHNFQDEARKLTTLDHENIVRWITFDRTQDGLHYFVMEFLDGEELEKVLRNEGRLPPKRVASILLQVLSALRRAHGAGESGALLHLDLKPENVFLLPPLAPGEPERVKVIDFGIGQHVGAEVRAAEHPELRSIFDLPPDELGRSIGSVAIPVAEAPEPPMAKGGKGKLPLRRVQRARGGTLLYASPEQCKHLAGHADIEALDGRSDLYSLGVMAFRMLTGQFPFARNDSAFQAIQNHLEAPPRKVGSLGVKIPRPLAAFVDRCLEKDRERRWKDAAEAQAVLQRIVHPPVSPLRIGVPIALVALAGLGAMYGLREPEQQAVALLDEAREFGDQAVEELYLGPDAPRRVLKVGGGVADAAERPELVVVDEDRRPLPGWEARWTPQGDGALEIVAGPDAESANAYLEVDGGRAGRWTTGLLSLHYLRAWNIGRVRVVDHDGERRLAPRGRRLELEAEGDGEGRLGLKEVEVSVDVLDGPSRGRAPVTLAGPLERSTNGVRGERVPYDGPALDPLAPLGACRVRLEVVARDRADQLRRAELELELAGPPVDFTAATGFVLEPRPDAEPLRERTVLLPANALRVGVDAPARVRLSLGTRPVLEREVSPGTPLVLALAELGIDGDEGTAGELLLALDESRFVDRASAVPRERRLAFYYSPDVRRLEALLRADGWSQGLLEGQENLVHPPPDAGLVVQTPFPNLWIEAACAPDGAAAEATPLQRVEGRFELAALDLAREGVYRLSVQPYVSLVDGQRGLPIPPERVYLLRVDRTAPGVRIELDGAQADEPFLADPDRRLRVSLEDHDVAELTWRLLRPDGTLQGSGALDPASVDGTDRLALPRLHGESDPDGRYELLLSARDAAGNERTARRAWELARTGPLVSLLAPREGGSGGTWLLAGRRLELEVEASDANEVREVSARVLYAGRAVVEASLERSAGGAWILPDDRSPAVYPWWSGKELAIELRAVDRAGQGSTLRRVARLPRVEDLSELVVAPRGGDRPAGAPLAEVPLPRDYVFGGRRRDDGLRWNVEIPRSEQEPSFFLDTREVSRAEYLAFVEASDGYGDPRWWEQGPPDEARRRELRGALAGEPEAPATGVTWSEAAAFAAWCGKRLPTLFEWEVAVRGAEYRETPADERIAGAAAGWPANLCTGPREWTSTPAELFDSTLDFRSQCKERPDLLLLPDGCELPSASGPVTAASEVPSSPAFLRRSDTHWTAGPGPGQGPSWSARSIELDPRRGPDLGFRCALSRSITHDRLDRGQYGILP